MKQCNCVRCNAIILEQEARLVYNDKEYCKWCIIWMIDVKKAIPNDGSISGGLLAKELSET